MAIQNAHFLVIPYTEFRAWLKKQKVTRRINVLQVHHTWVPNYSTFKGNHLGVLGSMRNSHLGRGFADIAQQFSVFPDGMIGISLGRTLNDAPAGIKGLNANAICIENIANFDNGGDKISDVQRKAILRLYAELADFFNIPVDTSHVVYHHWMSASGKKAFDFVTGKATGAMPAKSCPGDDYWGHGNKVADANRGFIPDLKKELALIRGGGTASVAPKPTPVVKAPIIKEEDLPMTPTEKKAFDALVAQVEAQTKTIASLKSNVAALEKSAGPLATIPAWAEKPMYNLKNYKYDGKNALIDTTTGGTMDFYRLATLVDRYIQSTKTNK